MATLTELLGSGIKPYGAVPQSEIDRAIRLSTNYIPPSGQAFEPNIASVQELLNNQFFGRPATITDEQRAQLQKALDQYNTGNPGYSYVTGNMAYTNRYAGGAEDPRYVGNDYNYQRWDLTKPVDLGWSLNNPMGTMQNNLYTIPNQSQSSQIYGNNYLLSPYAPQAQQPMPTLTRIMNRTEPTIYSQSKALIGSNLNRNPTFEATSAGSIGTGRTTAYDQNNTTDRWGLSRLFRRSGY